MMPAWGAEAVAPCAMAARLTVAAILAQSAWQALRDADAHAASIAGYRLLPDWAVAPAAWVLPVLSAAAALALALPSAGVAGPALAGALLAIFTAAIAINLRRGRVHIDCGCGGARGQRISASLVWRNLMLLALLALGLAAPAGWNAAAAAIALGAAAAATALYFAANQLLANQAAFLARGATS